MKDWLWLTNLGLGLSLGYSYARYHAFKNYFGIEQRIVDAMKKEGIKVYPGDRIFVIKDGCKIEVNTGDTPV